MKSATAASPPPRTHTTIRMKHAVLRELGRTAFAEGKSISRKLEELAAAHFNPVPRSTPAFPTGVTGPVRD